MANITSTVITSFQLVLSFIIFLSVVVQNYTSMTILNSHGGVILSDVMPDRSIGVIEQHEE